MSIYSPDQGVVLGNIKHFELASGLVVVQVFALPEMMNFLFFTDQAG
jgi:hypothetical protein